MEITCTDLPWGTKRKVGILLVHLFSCLCGVCVCTCVSVHSWYVMHMPHTEETNLGCFLSNLTELLRVCTFRERTASV